MGTSFTRGELTFTGGIGVRPVASNSLSSSGMALPVSTICCQTGSVATLKQKSPVSLMFFNVCFSEPSGLRAMVNEIIGGTTQTTVKKLNGARLVRPCPSIVDAQPMGRGTTEPVNSR